LRTVGIEVDAEDEIGMPSHRLDQLAARHLPTDQRRLSHGEAYGGHWRHDEGGQWRIRRARGRARRQRTSHSLAVRSSEAEAMYCESAVKAQSEIPCEWPSSVRTHRQVLVDQRRTIVSALDDASHLPSGENLTADTALLWPMQTCFLT
jgi:hypothetical protein